MAGTEDYFRIYEDLIGYVPPRIRARVTLGGAVDPQTLAVVEQVREQCMYPAVFDVKTAQLMLFGILLGQVAAGAEHHAHAAHRAGATAAELHAVAGLAFLFRGLPAFNLGAEIINKVIPLDTGGAA
jgi:4-carboxymuconolactone decarboxylase